MAMDRGGHETDELRSEVCEKDLNENISKGKKSEELFEDEAEGNLDKSIVINTEDDMGSTRSLTASKDGLQMDMDDFKRFNEELSDLLLLSLSDYNSNIEDQVYFEGIREKYLECCTDVKSKIGDLTQERLETLSQKTSNDQN
ncbi:Hypothetical predicted protein [Paramuricea clavata]|uniref:Uncharacterized protein n=1 Tax=Paramuricea clavata TaxID=317549 RepID=A0A7D9L7Y4_PARCT|nr:Hypothetical predicted protein [Paramuricea clavata]